MALTYWNIANAGGSGNFIAETLYHEVDRNIVLNQEGAESSGLVNMTFRGEDLTVFAARNAGGQILALVALPCPPYHDTIRPESTAGNILT